MKSIAAILLVLFCAACQQGPDKKQGHNTVPVPAKEKTVIIKILPLGKTNPDFIKTTLAQVKEVISNVELLPHEEMPASAYYPPRKRYRADTLIHWMSDRAKDNEVYLGITRQDISTTKGSNPDHGIMGLGFQPGNACIASDFRLRNKKSFFKVVIHELGHTAGLPHCPVKTCFMRDAEGGDPTGEEKEFCPACKAFLKNKGWRL